ncbi:ARM repeat-containing protein [Epithele typhae]|uniref:ARM repeat-containing protein n=1 Tax=Epithele typhae TaxID=378194 RepID=UPI002008BF2C|nr:ARM repeat-containing protein [Epithele typhae]KAH9932111.1 ARM repeat-containing protein [Epithele typhae]
MDSHTAAASTAFVPLFDTLPSSRTSAASIWAPQPQPSDTAWDTFRRGNFGNHPPPPPPPGRLRPAPFRSSSFPVHHAGEDVFGPLGFELFGRQDVGAIGDGRKRLSPNFDDSELHVEQLLRSLNLNSPGPLPPMPKMRSDVPRSPTSPDLSPISTTSALLTPTDLSPAKAFDQKLPPNFDFNAPVRSGDNNSLMFETGFRDGPPLSQAHFWPQSQAVSPDTGYFPSFEPFPESASTTSPRAASSFPQADRRRLDTNGLPTTLPPLSWGGQRFRTSSEWVKADDIGERSIQLNASENILRSATQQMPSPPRSTTSQPINFLSLLHPSSSPPYDLFVARIIKSSDQQASIFLQQKLKVADAEERTKIVDAICAKGFEMMAHRFGNWAVQRCLEATSSVDERRKIVSCMRTRVVELATNCYGCHVLQKALDCEEEVRLLIVRELLLGDPAQTLVNKHASHVWSKIMELSWTPPAPPIFAFVNKSLKGKWASLACHETGSLVVQHAFENLEESAKDGIVDELLKQGPLVFGEVAKNQWGSYCIQHILEHGSQRHRYLALEHLLGGLLEYATNEQGIKSITKALKEGGKETLDRIIKRMCEPAKTAMIVDLALSVTGSQLIASVLPNADKDQRALLYESIRGHIVTLRGCKTGSKVIWLFDRMRAYYGY